MEQPAFKDEHCIKCRRLIRTSHRSIKYCSVHCRKLYLKNLWRKRNAERLQAYNREYRKAKNGGEPYQSGALAKRLREGECLKCGTARDLQVAHVKPLWAGGTHKHVVTFCRKHHYRFDNALREFWSR